MGYGQVTLLLMMIDWTLDCWLTWTNLNILEKKRELCFMKKQPTKANWHIQVTHSLEQLKRIKGTNSRILLQPSAWWSYVFHIYSKMKSKMPTCIILYSLNLTNVNQLRFPCSSHQPSHWDPPTAATGWGALACASGARDWRWWKKWWCRSTSAGKSLVQEMRE